jgi:hypothetical protein
VEPLVDPEKEIVPVKPEPTLTVATPCPCTVVFKLALDVVNVELEVVFVDGVTDTLVALDIGPPPPLMDTLPAIGKELYVWIQVGLEKDPCTSLSVTFSVTVQVPVGVAVLITRTAIAPLINSGPNVTTPEVLENVARVVYGKPVSESATYRDTQLTLSTVACTSTPVLVYEVSVSTRPTLLYPIIEIGPTTAFRELRLPVAVRSGVEATAVMELLGLIATTKAGSEATAAVLAALTAAVLVPSLIFVVWLPTVVWFAEVDAPVGSALDVIVVLAKEVVTVPVIVVEVSVTGMLDWSEDKTTGVELAEVFWPRVLTRAAVSYTHLTLPTM